MCFLSAVSSYLDRHTRNSRRRQRPGDPHGGRAASDFSRRTAESHHIQSNGKKIRTLPKLFAEIEHTHVNPLVYAENIRILVGVSDRETGK